MAKIFLPKLKGRLWSDKGTVLKTGNMQRVTKKLGPDGNPLKDDNGRFVYEKTGDKYYIKTIKGFYKDPETGQEKEKIELVLSLGQIFDNEKTTANGTDQSGPVTVEGESMKYAAWYVEDAEFSGEILDITLSKVIEELSPAPSPQSTQAPAVDDTNEDYPF